MITGYLLFVTLFHCAAGNQADDDQILWTFNQPQDVPLSEFNVEPQALHDSEYFHMSQLSEDAMIFSQASAVGRRPGSATNTHSCDSVRAVPSRLRRAAYMAPRGLSRFYQKYTEAYGIPIVASGRVSDDALKRACYIARFLLADRYDVRNSYYKYSGRMGIIGKNELTTNIPEHSHLPPYWNTRARGFGATVSGPVCTGAEENILCQRPDRWGDEDIAIHEFAHGVHLLGARFAIRGYHSRLTDAYNSARRQRLWANTYAMSTTQEYFAEGARAYFNVKPYSRTANGVRNHITTRSQLRTYDITLYDLISEVFPCGNEYIKRCPGNGKTQADLRQAEARHNIRSNCGTDGGGGGTGGGDGTTTVGTGGNGGCTDSNNHCRAWAADRSQSYCTSNAFVMENCRRSCGTCTNVGATTTTPIPPTVCRDDNANCEYWAGIGQCNRYRTYMSTNCKASCDVC